MKLPFYVPDFRTWRQETLASIARDLLRENQHLREEIEDLKAKFQVEQKEQDKND